MTAINKMPARPPELLAPAGSFARAEAAFAHGADAVYAGIGRFNLRAHSPNFSVDEFRELVKLAASIDKRVYGVLNIMPNDEMLAPIEDTLRQLADAGCKPHAFIISDPGVLSLVNEIFADDVSTPAGAAIGRPPSPDPQKIQLHLSTQSGCFNSASMKFWRKQGISRVILPRELNLEQIRRLSSMNIMETEIFIHGAMCVSISGRCLLGAYYNGRHPNLGDCPQPCRFRYRIIPLEDGGGGVGTNDVDGVNNINNINDVNCVDGGADQYRNWFDAEESSTQGVYLLNSKDLCTISILPALMESGAASFKIEGRNKSAHYAASVVKVYRDAINTYLADPKNYKVKDWWIAELDTIDHRPYTTGFYDGDPIKQELFTSKAQVGFRLFGTVKAVIDGRPVIDVKNSFSATAGSAPESMAKTESTQESEQVNVLPVSNSRSPFTLKFDAIRELDGTVCERARPNRLVILDGCSERLRVGDMLRQSQG